jgi:hypothetical protein
VISFLLDSQHDPNYPSPAHGLQGVLEVVIRRHSLNEDPGELKFVLELLHKSGASPEYQADGKSLLIIALDMQNAEKTVFPLLNAFMRPLVNGESIFIMIRTSSTPRFHTSTRINKNHLHLSEKP